MSDFIAAILTTMVIALFPILAIESYYHGFYEGQVSILHPEVTK